MRYLTLLLALTASSALAQSPCCPYLQPVQVLPANPGPTDNVRLVFTVVTPGQGRKISTSFTRNGLRLDFTGCYFSGPLAALQTFRDTVAVGTLPAGTYTITLTGLLSADMQQCTELQRNVHTQTLQVGTSLATQPAADADWALYPVPTAGRTLTLAPPPGLALVAVRLLDAVGRETYARPTGGDPQVVLPALPAGTYYLQARFSSGEARTRRVVLE